MKLPVGISDFKQLVTGNYTFVDKTFFIKEVINNGAGVILITRPRRFGKTLNLSMLYHFLQIHFPQDSNLFNGLAISEDTEFCFKHQQQYPVIFISFKDIKRPNYADACAAIMTLIKQLYANHRYLLEGDLLHQDEKDIFTSILNVKASLENIRIAIKQLSEYMQRKFGKPAVILIDEYDTPIQEAYIEGYYAEMIKLMRGILGEALKDNPYAAKAVLTGITRISQESMFSGLNNVKVYSLLREEYGQYFGFTEAEVRQLLTEASQEANFESIKEWYNGYQIGKHTLYNPWSIINCLDSGGELELYWVNTSSDDLIGKLLGNASLNIKQLLEVLLQGEVIEQPISESLVFADIEDNEEALWSLFLYAGYLKVLSSKLGDYNRMAKIAIPNKEVGFVYRKIVSRWFTGKVKWQSYEGFIQSLAGSDTVQFKKYLSDYLLQSSSYFDFNKNSPEQVFHTFILGLVVGLREHYEIYSNKESGLGRADVTFIPRDKKRKGILLEFKIAETAELLAEKAQDALQQIKDKQYVETFRQQKIGTVLAIGLAFCGKQVELTYEELDLK